MVKKGKFIFTVFCKQVYPFKIYNKGGIMLKNLAYMFNLSDDFVLINHWLCMQISFVESDTFINLSGVNLATKWNKNWSTHLPTDVLKDRDFRIVATQEVRWEGSLV